MDNYKILSFICKKEMCTGCGACYNICPIQCIKMCEDEEGFLYPYASNNCINCGKCKRVCPQINKSTLNSLKQKKAFAAVSKDNGIWRQSSSGGAFSEICKIFSSDEDTMFVGAVWKGLKVEHKCVIGFDNIKQLCKSKYIASDINDTFKNIKLYLESNKKVVFCGTPCQVAGLRNYLRKDYENLLLLDLVCHGVGSQKIFDSCIQIINHDLRCEIISYEFRAKTKVYVTNHIQRIFFKKRNEYKSEYIYRDPYIQLFLTQNCLRKCCGKNCRYRTELRQGDITIADFKGLEKVFPKLYGTKKNYSSIIINTDKGYKLIQDLKKNMTMYECSIEDIQKWNPLFSQQTEYSKDRDAFFAEYQIDPENAIRKRTQKVQLYKRSMSRKLYDICPLWARKLIAQFIHKLGGG